VQEFRVIVEQFPPRIARLGGVPEFAGEHPYPKRPGGFYAPLEIDMAFAIGVCRALALPPQKRAFSTFFTLQTPKGAHKSGFLR
jgi:hypothetical protein